VNSALDAWHEMMDPSIIHKILKYNYTNANQGIDDVNTEGNLYQFIKLQYARGIYE